MRRAGILMGVALIRFGAFALTGEDVLAKMDLNRDYKTISGTGTMEIHVGDEVRVKTMTIKAITAGSKSIVEFTNPEDKGTRYLMLDKDLWIYFPEEEDVVKISGHMLKEGMMGSDVSYEDALESDMLSKKYTITLKGEEVLDGRACHVIELNAKTRDAPYYRRVMWVDKETFVAVKEQMYAKSGKLLKEARVLEVKTIGKRRYPARVEVVNKLRKDSKTVFTMDQVVLDATMDEKEFSMRYLRR